LNPKFVPLLSHSRTAEQLATMAFSTATSTVEPKMGTPARTVFLAQGTVLPAMRYWSRLFAQEDRCVGAQCNGRDAAEDGIGVEVVGLVEDGGIGLAAFAGLIGHEVDGVLGDAQSLVGIGGDSYMIGRDETAIRTGPVQCGSRRRA
jgi:hypothetical protein